MNEIQTMVETSLLGHTDLIRSKTGFKNCADFIQQVAKEGS